MAGERQPQHCTGLQYPSVTCGEKQGLAKKTFPGCRSKTAAAIPCRKTAITTVATRFSSKSRFFLDSSPAILYGEPYKVEYAIVVVMRPAQAGKRRFRHTMHR
ncbi:MAG: hypothetical protein LIP28_06570, partial [Deltaproteobacteria bacterium]|nr:hypothetical protein [Deltaproteobacteria bacterium]